MSLERKGLKRKAYLRRFGFGTKISLSIIAILLAFGIGLSIIISKYVSQALLTENKTRGISMAINLSARVVEPILSLDFLALKNLADQMLQTNKDVIYTFVTNETGEPLVHTFTGGFPIALKPANSVRDSEEYHVHLLSSGKELISDFAVPVLIGKDRLGTVRVGMSHNRIQEVVNGLLWAIFLSIGTGILIVGFVSTALARTVTRKIQVLHGAAEEIIKGNLNIQTSQLSENRCWEVVGCNQTECPAYGDDKHRCWYLVGTLCPTCAEGQYPSKIINCRSCEVYKSNAGDEIQDLAEFFDIMALTLKDRIETLKGAEENLKEQQRIFKTILDVTPDMVSLQDKDFRYQAVNKAFCSFLGKKEEEILGKTDAQLFSPDQAQKQVRENQELVQKGNMISSEKKIDGFASARWLHVIKTAVANPDGKVSGILCTSRDITEMKELQDRIVHAQRLETIGQLAAGVAHEINTPLGIILGYAQLSKEDAGKGTEIHENLSTIEKYARICRTIVSDLLGFSRQTESVKKALDINEMLGQVASVVEHTYGLDRIRIVRNLEKNLPLVYGDHEKLEQAFMNLINNAYDAIGSDGEISISTMHERNEREVVVRVADTGKGISPEIRSKIFDPFFTTKGVGKGTGLGLSVTFGIVKDHGGRIDFQSTTLEEISGRPDSGQGTGAKAGTVFTIRLPVHENQ
jgi:two-component system, NtrC family, sensor kinase